MTWRLKPFWSSPIIVFGFLVLVPGYVKAFSSMKRQIAPDNNAEHLAIENNPMQINYDEYPLIVPKRAAILLDRLMVALHHALEDEQNGSRKISDVYGKQRKQEDRGKFLQRIKTDNPSYVPNLTNDLNNDLDHLNILLDLPEDYDFRDLQLDNREYNNMRRGQGSDIEIGPNKGRVYWRCYFNAVTCF